jgi:hypothetical protein
MTETETDAAEAIEGAEAADGSSERNKSPLTKAEKKAASALARAIWMGQHKPDAFADGAARKAAYKAVRTESVKAAAKTIRRMKKAGIGFTYTASADTEGEDD